MAEDNVDNKDQELAAAATPPTPAEAGDAPILEATEPDVPAGSEAAATKKPKKRTSAAAARRKAKGETAEAKPAAPAEVEVKAEPAPKKDSFGKKLTLKLIEGSKSFGFIGEVARGMISSDAWTRRASFLFFFALTCMVSMMWVGWQHRQTEIARVETARTQAQALNEIFEKEQEKAHKKFTSVELGTFHVLIKRVEGVRQPAGVTNMAEFTVSVQCNTPEACAMLKGNLDPVRDQINQILIPMERKDLQQLEGKRFLKKMIGDKLNLWLPYGQKVDEVFFTRLVLN